MKDLVKISWGFSWPKHSRQLATARDSDTLPRGGAFDDFRKLLFRFE
jgi:hypothetical protein